MIKKFASVPDLLTAEHIRQVLENAGIRTLEVQSSPHASLAGGDSCYYVEVDERQWEEAEAAVRDKGLQKWIIE